MSVASLQFLYGDAIAASILLVWYFRARRRLRIALAFRLLIMLIGLGASLHELSLSAVPADQLGLVLTPREGPGG
jgi:hypothetical protein